MMDFSDKTVIVAGLGVSGRSMAEVLREQGAKVLTADEKKAEADIHDFDSIDYENVDCLCVSPVFPPSTPFIKRAQNMEIPILSEVELAWQLRVPNKTTGKPARWVGITGTNGKTTTTEMTSAMLTACGLTAPAVGNIGNAVSKAAVDPDNDVLCVELSSFQMHFTDSLELDTAAITNIAADHLDWHGGMENYAADKSKVYQNTREVIVYNADDARVTDLAFEAGTSDDCLCAGFTLSAPGKGMIGIDDGWIVDRTGLANGDPEETFRVAKITDFTHLAEPDGTMYPHLLADAMTSLCLVLGLGVDCATAVQALKEFSPGGHRIAKVAQLDTEQGAIKFIDDSKATNGHAAKASLNSFADGSVVWIAGGLAKGSRFEDVVAQEAPKIKAAVIIGEDQQPMLEAFAASAPDIPLTVVDPQPKESVMQRAVDAAGAYVEGDDVVLMAPACASFDQFDSYADRGDKFAEQAARWVKEHGKA